jgi:hypothetical protein
MTISSKHEQYDCRQHSISQDIQEHSSAAVMSHPVVSMFSTNFKAHVDGRHEAHSK